VKIAISQYEGQPEFVSFSCEMPDDLRANLQSVLHCVIDNHLILSLDIDGGET
jgi:hypothetical protein